MRPRNFWMRKALRVALRRNLACWLEVFLPIAFVLSLMCAAALLILRTLRLSEMNLWIVFAVSTVAGAAMSWLMAKRRFFSSADALVRLDEVGRLHNRLITAHAKVGQWPEPREVRDPARWNWRRLLGSLGFCALLLLGAAWVPVPKSKNVEHVTEPPLAWTQVESWLQTLEQSKLVQPEALEKLREQMNEIEQQSSENWYNQSSLEAGDTLRQQTEEALRSMMQDLQKAEAAIAAAEKSGEKLPPAELKALEQSLQKSVHGLEMGNLPLNKELLNNLKKLDATKLKQLSAEQLAAMREQLKAGTRVCEQCVRPKKDGFSAADSQSGGKGGGGPPAPLTLKDDQTNLHTKQTDTVANNDLSRAALGDVTGVNKGEHDVKKPKTSGPIAGGAIQSAGEGGDAVWRDSLTPAEREVLQRFFK